MNEGFCLKKQKPTKTINYLPFTMNYSLYNIQKMRCKRMIKYIPTSWNNNLKEGDIVSGTVTNIKPYGAFIELEGGITGLLHIEDISVARIKSPKERLKIGQNVNIMIKSIDRKTNRIILSYKEMYGTWEDNIKQYKEGMTVTGIAREIEKRKNGIFVELKPNLVGLAEYKENIEYGNNVDVYIKKIVPEKKKIKLIIVGSE